VLVVVVDAPAAVVVAEVLPQAVRKIARLNIAANKILADRFLDVFFIVKGAVIKNKFSLIIGHSDDFFLIKNPMQGFNKEPISTILWFI
jgi:hypothetical protein